MVKNIDEITKAHMWQLPLKTVSGFNFIVQFKQK